MKKKILIVASPWIGGSGTVAFRIGEELAATGYEVHSVSYEIPFKKLDTKHLVHYHKIDGFSYPLFPFPLYELALAEEIVRLVKKHKIDIIHAHYGILFGHASSLAKQILTSENKKVKLIITFHGSDVLGFDLEKPGTVIPKHLTQWTIRTADEVTVASNNLNQYLGSIYKVKRKVHVVPNFIDTYKYALGNVDLNYPTVTHISNFRKVKQTILVVEAFQKIQEKVPNARLFLIGDGPDKEKVMKFVTEQKLKNVSFLGVIKNDSDIPKYLKQSHVLMLPSIYENFSLVALEAQACGVPVVASSAGGNPELVIDNQTGYLCDVKDVEAYAKNAVLLLQNKNLWKKFSDSARKHTEKFDTKKVVQKYIKLYEDKLVEMPFTSKSESLTL